MHSTILDSTNMTTRSLNNKLRTCLIDLKLSKKTPPNRAMSCILCQTPISEDTCPTHVCMCPIHRAPAKHMSDTCPRCVPRKRSLHPIKTCFPFHLSSFHSTGWRCQIFWSAAEGYCVVLEGIPSAVQMDLSTNLHFFSYSIPFSSSFHRNMAQS